MTWFMKTFQAWPPLAAGINALVRAVPDCVGPSRPTRLDPGEDIDGVASAGRSIAYLHRRGPGFPSTRRAGGADEDLSLRPIAVTDATEHDEVASGGLFVAADQPVRP